MLAEFIIYIINNTVVILSPLLVLFAIQSIPTPNYVMRSSQQSTAIAHWVGRFLLQWLHNFVRLIKFCIGLTERYLLQDVTNVTHLFSSYHILKLNTQITTTTTFAAIQYTIQ